MFCCFITCTFILFLVSAPNLTSLFEYVSTWINQQVKGKLLNKLNFIINLYFLHILDYPHFKQSPLVCYIRFLYRLKKQNWKFENLCELLQAYIVSDRKVNKLGSWIQRIFPFVLQVSVAVWCCIVALGHLWKHPLTLRECLWDSCTVSISFVLIIYSF